MRLKTKQAHEIADLFGATSVADSLPEETDSATVASFCGESLVSLRGKNHALKSPKQELTNMIEAPPITTSPQDHAGWGRTGSTPRCTPRLDSETSAPGDKAAATHVSAAIKGHAVRRDTKKTFEMAEMFGATQNGEPVITTVEGPSETVATQAIRFPNGSAAPALCGGDENAAAESFADDLMADVIATTAIESAVHFSDTPLHAQIPLEDANKAGAVLGAGIRGMVVRKKTKGLMSIKRF